jgi:metal-responsive CopG/Arc/MetJ family transcriptional regulator
MSRKKGHTRLVSIRIEEEVLLQLDILSRETGKMRSEMIREALKQYAEKFLKNAPKVIIVEEI